MKKQTKALLCIIIIFIISLVVYFVISLKNNDIRKAELERFQTGEYQSVFLSMHDIENYSEEDFINYRGLHTFVTPYMFKNEKDLLNFLNEIMAADKELTNIYLGIDPKKMKELPEEEINLIQWIEGYSQIEFEILFSYPSMREWLSLSSDKKSDLIQKYLAYLEDYSYIENVRVYYLGSEEWLISNQSNYEANGKTTVDVSKLIFLSTFCDHNYEMNVDNIGIKLEILNQLIEEERGNPTQSFKDSKSAVVMLGDSIIGNYLGSLSVPGVVANYSDAYVFNCGYGGLSATQFENGEASFPAMVDALITGNVEGIPQDKPIYQGAVDFNALSEKKYDQLYFIINYGLNDYFGGWPVSTEDKFDIFSYEGALRLGIAKLREAYPDCQIILMSPNYCTYFNDGMDRMSSEGGMLIEYVDSTAKLSEELSTYYMNNYYDLGINSDNWETYLSDGCHLNEMGRYLLGKRIVSKLITITQ